MHQKRVYHQNATWNRCNSEYNPRTTNNLMLSFQYRQGINAKSLARHGNGAHKPLKTEFTKTRHQTLTYKLLKCKSRAKERF